MEFHIYIIYSTNNEDSANPHHQSIFHSVEWTCPWTSSLVARGPNMCWMWKYCALNPLETQFTACNGSWVNVGVLSHHIIQLKVSIEHLEWLCMKDHAKFLLARIYKGVKQQILAEENTSLPVSSSLLSQLCYSSPWNPHSHLNNKYENHINFLTIAAMKKSLQHSILIERRLIPLQGCSHIVPKAVP